MRIALVLAGPYPALRGSQVLLRQLATGLESRGHTVVPVTYGARAADLPGPRPTRILRDAVLVARLWRVVRRRAIDVIHAHNYEAAIAGLVVARATGRALVYHGHNALGEELPTYFRRRPARRLAARLGRLLDAQVPRRADFCIAVSPELRDVLRRRGVAEDGLACISPPPGDIGGAPPPGQRPSGRVCYAGNLDGYQNLGFLLRCFARVRSRLPAARLVLVAHAGDRDAAARLAAGPLGEGVEIVHARSYDEVRERLAVSDVAVCPRAERSGFPMKLLNYMATGKAIVASAGSAKGLEDDVTARVVPDDDEAAFARAVVALLEDAATRERLGAAARRVVEDPRVWDDVLDRIESIYERVTGPARPATAGLGRAVCTE